MAYTVNKIDVWTGRLKDRPGGLADKLDPIAEAGNNCEFVLARRDKPGSGLVFLSLVRASKQSKAAEKAGLKTDPRLHALRIEGPDKPGLCARVARIVGDAGINLRGLSGVAIGKRCAIVIALDSEKDAAKAQRIIKQKL
jgi:hypothetical protein